MHEILAGKKNRSKKTEEREGGRKQKEGMKGGKKKKRIKSTKQKCSPSVALSLSKFQWSTFLYNIICNFICIDRNIITTHSFLVCNSRGGGGGKTQKKIAGGDRRKFEKSH